MTRVLFLHGLESGPCGNKAQVLSAIFGPNSVCAPDMQVSLHRFDKKNSMVRALVYSPQAWLLALATLVEIIILITDFDHGYFGLGVFALLFYVGMNIVRDVVRKVNEVCIALQKQALDTFRPDLVVGSSYGGGIALFLIARVGFFWWNIL
jgi:hypothetical protein